MIDTAKGMVEVVKAANHFGVLTFSGNGRTIIVTRNPDGIRIEFDYMEPVQ